ncbi:hypothetical protein [Streptomyces sp. NPDC059009]|uniref:hypothetical protein n=1 Tax=Streptomyces sp. NPDC059009 TaxID=3346694 RepID=UPI0036807180
MTAADPSRDPLIDRADAAIGIGHVGQEKAAEVVAAVPESRYRALDWLRTLADAGQWRSFERLAGVALHVHPEGLAEILISALASAGSRGEVNVEDLVDMLGELRAPEAVGALAALLHERRESDAPFFPLSVKSVQSLAEIGTPEALTVLRGVATGADWPNPVRWHAAEELGIEEELGYDEDEMLRP